jgi:hypothetical protein
VDKKKVQTKYSPTHLMLVDYYMNSLQGKLFRRFREVIMGYRHINELMLDPELSLKECVENRNNTVVENSEENINNNGNKTYAEIVSSKKAPMTSVSHQTDFTDETQQNKKKTNIRINQEECK